MDPRLQHIYENLDKMKIGVDEPFQFHCTSQDFTPQFRENLKKTREFFQTLLASLEG